VTRSEVLDEAARRYFVLFPIDLLILRHTNTVKIWKGELVLQIVRWVRREFGWIMSEQHCEQ
jgi:hypothetical protein